MAALKKHFTPDEALEKLYQHGLMDGTEQGFLQTLIDNTIEIEENAFFWQEHFRVDGNELSIDKRDLKKNPAWSVQQITKRTVPMADAMAPLSETMQLDADGGEVKTGSIFQYGKGLFSTSMSKMELEARLQALGPDRDLVQGYVRGVADLIKTINLRASHMAAQTISMGGKYGNTISVSNVAGGTTTTQGASGVVANQNSYIPSTNFKKAGTKVWTAADCDIPEQMKTIETDFKLTNANAAASAFEWDIPYDMLVNVLMKNSYFIAEVNRWIAMYGSEKVIIVNNGTSRSDVSSITMEQIISYSRSDISKIAPIRVIREQQQVQDFTTTTTVKGWKSGVAVLRPIGYAGVLVHSQIADVELMRSGEVNKNIDFAIAQAQGFIYIINKVVPNGMLKAYHTDVLSRFATVLDETPLHIVVDTTTAN